ncbi:MAG: SPASM domain-containing protein, partial [Bdellovibrionales bacterium]|nr:SPASM domain-containing protein [Bdellovibrionales bacterium]
GGEPTLYPQFAEVARILKRKRRFAITCTNGTRLHQFSDVIDENPFLTFLISLDGIESVNDRIRGKGVYQKVTQNIRRIKSEMKNPPYIGVQFTVGDRNVSSLLHFCEEMEDLGVDWVLLNPTWFVSSQQGQAYKTVMEKEFGVSPTSHEGYMHNQNFDHRIFQEQVGMVLKRKWRMQISSYLKTEEEIKNFYERPGQPVSNSFCYKQWMRMDISPSGDVHACSLYPDYKIGDLKTASVPDVWNSQASTDFRNFRIKNVLPICSNCSAIYLYDSKRKYL